MDPQQRYASDIADGRVSADAAQSQVVEQLQQLYQELQLHWRKQSSTSGRLKRWAGIGVQADLAGIYLWGGVGRGKTFLMDLFYDCLPTQRAMRTHFHRFMQRVHGELAALQGRKNPLQEVADRLADEAEVLCFDEFFVADIGDAMILSGLLEALFNRGLVLVATSNIPPDELYRDGLQRQRFVPAIALLQRHTRVVEIEQGIDYRLRSLSQATLYHAPYSADTDEVLLQSFRELLPDRSKLVRGEAIAILNRQIPSRYSADDVAWFDFTALCDGPRSAFDYVELARLYHAIIISGVPVLDDSSNDQARRFVSLIDELYDRRVKLIIAADAPISELYQGRSLAFEFARTRSRLVEMQSHEYLCREHRA